MFEKLYNAVRSRTVWTIVLMFIISGIQGVHNALPADAIPAIDAFLAACAIYFRVNPRV